jgi:hypothetical protein
VNARPNLNRSPGLPFLIAGGVAEFDLLTEHRTKSMMSVHPVPEAYKFGSTCVRGWNLTSQVPYTKYNTFACDGRFQKPSLLVPFVTFITNY